MKPLYSVFEELARSRGVTAYRVSQDLHFTSVLFTDWKKGKSCPKSDKILKIADYFGVSSDVFYGIEPMEKQKNDLKVALFGGDGEVTDEMWEEVKQFAQFVKARNAKKAPTDGSGK